MEDLELKFSKSRETSEVSYKFSLTQIHQNMGLRSQISSRVLVYQVQGTEFKSSTQLGGDGTCV